MAAPSVIVLGGESEDDAGAVTLERGAGAAPRATPAPASLGVKSGGVKRKKAPGGAGEGAAGGGAGGGAGEAAPLRIALVGTPANLNQNLTSLGALLEALPGVSVQTGALRTSVRFGPHYLLRLSGVADNAPQLVTARQADAGIARVVDAADLLALLEKRYADDIPSSAAALSARRAALTAAPRRSSGAGTPPVSAAAAAGEELSIFALLQREQGPGMELVDGGLLKGRVYGEVATLLDGIHKSVTGLAPRRLQPKRFPLYLAAQAHELLTRANAGLQRILNTTR
jgi:hypothetical protein